MHILIHSMFKNVIFIFNSVLAAIFLSCINFCQYLLMSRLHITFSNTRTITSRVYISGHLIREDLSYILNCTAELNIINL
jgi:hypothetical protein